jgi:hypothetical protein
MKRRRLWLPLLLTLVGLLACGAALFRKIGLGELVLVLAPLALVFVIESTRYIARRFWAGYRSK